MKIFNISLATMLLCMSSSVFSASPTIIKVNGQYIITIAEDVVASSPVPVKSPAPAPTPAPTQTGSTLDKTAVPQNMALLSAGYWRSTHLGVSGAKTDNECYIQTRLGAQPRAGSTVLVTRKERTNVDYTKCGSAPNIKNPRHSKYSLDGSGYSNCYWSYNGSNTSRKFTVEPGDGSVAYNYRTPTRWNVAYFDIPYTPGQWQTTKETVTFASSETASDGGIKVEVCDGNGINCQTVLEQGGLVTGAPWTDYGSQMVLANSNSTNKFPPEVYFEAYAPIVQVIK